MECGSLGVIRRTAKVVVCTCTATSECARVAWARSQARRVSNTPYHRAPRHPPPSGTRVVQSFSSRRSRCNQRAERSVARMGLHGTLKRRPTLWARTAAGVRRRRIGPRPPVLPPARGRALAASTFGAAAPAAPSEPSEASAGPTRRSHAGSSPVARPRSWSRRSGCACREAGGPSSPEHSREGWRSRLLGCDRASPCWCKKSKGER